MHLGQIDPIAREVTAMWLHELLSMKAEILTGVTKEDSRYAGISTEAGRMWDALVDELMDVLTSA